MAKGGNLTYPILNSRHDSEPKTSFSTGITIRAHPVPLVQLLSRYAQRPGQIPRQQCLFQTIPTPSPFVREEQPEDVFTGTRVQGLRVMSEP